MGVEDLMKNEDIRLSDLKKGKTYRGELIIERDNDNYLNMVTAKKVSEEIWTNRYHVISQMSKVKVIILDGGQEYSSGDKEYDELNKMLENAA